MPPQLYLATRQVPLNEAGNAAFNSLVELLKVFSEQEVLLLVNRQLDYTEQQKRAHRKYQKKNTAFLVPFKKKAKEMFDVSWDLLTDEERARVLEALQEEQRQLQEQRPLAAGLRAKIPLRKEG